MATAKTIKLIIFEQEGVDSEQQRLVLLGEQLKDGRHFGDGIIDATDKFHDVQASLKGEFDFFLLLKLESKADTVSFLSLPLLSLPLPTAHANKTVTVVLHPLPAKKELEDLHKEDLKRSSAHFNDSQAVWAREDVVSGLGAGKGISDAALAETKRIAGVFRYTADGYHKGARLLKDITEAEADTEATGSTYYGPLAGHGPVAQRQMLTFACHLPNKFLNADRPEAGSTKEIANLCGLFIDIWIILVHCEVIIAIVLWICWITSVSTSPTFVVTSPKLANILLCGLPTTTLHPTASSDELHRFFLAFDSTVLNNICDKNDRPSWHRLPLPGYLSIASTLLVVPFPTANPTIQTWRLALLQVDIGILKYDPTHEVLLRELIAAIELKA